jgi:hypothetical protein
MLQLRKLVRRMTKHQILCHELISVVLLELFTRVLSSQAPNDLRRSTQCACDAKRASLLKARNKYHKVNIITAGVLGTRLLFRSRVMAHFCLD